MSVVEWMFTTSIAPKKYLSMRRISYDEMVKQWDIEAINQYERGVLESVFKMKQKKSAKVALNGARLAGNTAFSVERHASSVERRALKGGNPTAYRLTLAAKDNGFLSSSRSHLASGPDIDTFLTLVANHNLSPQGGQGRLPVLIGDIVEIYSLKRDQNILIVETQDGQHKVLDLSKGTIEDFNHAKHQGALVREKALEEDLFKLHEADSIPSPSSPNTNTRTLMIHLDGFGKNKGAISNLLKKADERIQGNTQVYLAGQPEEIATAESLLRELSLKHKARLSTASPDPQSQLLLTHLVPVNELEALKAHFRDKHPKITNQWVSMESLISREDGRVGVFSFSSVTSLLELVASGDLESATSFFNQITGYKVSTEEFKALIQGDIQLAHKYPIQPILKTALRDAERLYILSRSFTTSA